ncbi:MAG TPA: hypothetical protein VFQ07_14125 [Candidatus Polarisedimenticolia bacterium]|nr:hypothetical protein [Candidatus Polarisedimenticolia bacterium]
MRRSGMLLCLLVPFGLTLIGAPLLQAGSASGSGRPSQGSAETPGKEAREKESARKKAGKRTQGGPAAPTGAPRPIAAGDEPGAAGTVHVHVNSRGQTVYEIAPAHFDVSAPLRDLAAHAVPMTEEEEESPSNPLLPRWRVPHAGVPDPVVQSEIGGGKTSLMRPILQEAPAIGFDFPGVPQLGAVPPDTNGSIGLTQYVMTANVRYQVWSLNRATKTATSVLGPVAINTLWAGFTGPCETQNAGDPIVLYDKFADRWLISQFTTTISGGSYFQCVALSTTGDATGPYNRWSFTVPGGIFGDYPHFGVWPDAYYMMAHGFTSASANGTYVAGIFAAMDRPRMLAGNPGATWQVILDPNEGGHMPADLDGVTPPPVAAPGIFVSIHGTSMTFYRMKVDFNTPANTVRTTQGSSPIAPATGACILASTPGTCIPQPGTTRLLDSLGDRLMYRAAYRNFLDHESLVVSHSVDPSVSGVQSGVRWYDFRLSGGPSATCPSYPCTFQQGTVADVAGGRARWMPSIAMDAAENILVGYSTSGKTNGTENHSIRYTGRAKNDPPGQMTVPEGTIITGKFNNTNNSRWGDYTSMSVDPADDCTFWHANEYYFTLANSWLTRVTSVAFPAGTGDGACPPTTCPSRPASAPVMGAASVPGLNQIQINWTGIVPQPGSYAIERAVGACGSEGLYQPLGAVAGTASSFTDTSVQGGLTYSYRILAASDAAGRCQALIASSCASATATGTCNLRPQFTGAASASSDGASTCGIDLSWSAGTSSCPLTPNLRYNVYRGTTPDFVPAAGNRIAACVPGPASYTDTANVSSGVTYYYVVRAEDDSTGNGGACGGNEEQNGVVINGTAYGPGLQSSPGTWIDNGGDGTSLLRLNVAGSGDTPDPAWRFVKTANDAGANHTPAGAFAYRNAGPAAGDSYFPSVCAEMQTPPLQIGAGTVNLTYWERHQVEYHWDGIVVEYALNGGPWTTVPAPSNQAAGCSATDSVTNWETLSCTGVPAGNACGYPTTQNAINGPLAGGTDCNTWATSTAVISYVHRCHPIGALEPGNTIQFRWRFTSDEAAEFAGFYLDDIAVSNINLPNACVPNVCGGAPNGASCSDGNPCTQNDSCQSGVCAGGSPVVCAPLDSCHLAGTCDAGSGQCSNPPRTDGSTCDDANACTTGTTCTGGVCGGGTIVPPAPLGDSVAFGADSTTLGWSDPPGNYNVYRGLRSTPWTYDQVCLQSHVAGSSISDPATPAQGNIFFYLVTRITACGESTPGNDSGGSPRPNPSPCP